MPEDKDEGKFRETEDGDCEDLACIDGLGDGVSL